MEAAALPFFAAWFRIFPEGWKSKEEEEGRRAEV